MEAIRSSETLVNARTTQRHIPEDDSLQIWTFSDTLCLTFIIEHLVLLTKQVGLSSNTYSGGVWFKSWLEYWQSWLRCHVVYLGLFKQMAGLCLEIWLWLVFYVFFYSFFIVIQSFGTL
jgi:hypothetical protein